MVMTETAVPRNPKTPDWDGLDAMMSQKISSMGAADVSKFAGWVSKIQSEHAQVMKQGRLLRGENEQQRKRRGAQKGGAAGGNE